MHLSLKKSVFLFLQWQHQFIYIYIFSPFCTQKENTDSLGSKQEFSGMGWMKRSFPSNTTQYRKLKRNFVYLVFTNNVRYMKERNPLFGIWSQVKDRIIWKSNCFMPSSNKLGIFLSSFSLKWVLLNIAGVANLFRHSPSMSSSFSLVSSFLISSKMS